MKLVQLGSFGYREYVLAQLGKRQLTQARSAHRSDAKTSTSKSRRISSHPGLVWRTLGSLHHRLKIPIVRPRLILCGNPPYAYFIRVGVQFSLNYKLRRPLLSAICSLTFRVTRRPFHTYFAPKKPLIINFVMDSSFARKLRLVFRSFFDRSSLLFSASILLDAQDLKNLADRIDFRTAVVIWSCTAFRSNSNQVQGSHPLKLSYSRLWIWLFEEYHRPMPNPESSDDRLRTGAPYLLVFISLLNQTTFTLTIAPWFS